MSPLATYRIKHQQTRDRPSPFIFTSSWPISRCTRRRVCRAVEVEPSLCHRRVALSLSSALIKKFALRSRFRQFRRRSRKNGTSSRFALATTLTRRTRARATTPGVLLSSPRPQSTTSARVRSRSRLTHRALVPALYIGMHGMYIYVMPDRRGRSHESLDKSGNNTVYILLP